MDSESQVTMNIMTFMATELKKSPDRPVCGNRVSGAGNTPGIYSVYGRA